MKSKTIEFFFPVLLAVLVVLGACSEESGEEDEYANWKTRNDAAFLDTLAYARNRIALGDSTWKVFLSWSLKDQTPYSSNTLTYAADDSIVVHVLQVGTGSGCPIVTDSVRVHYAGYLINGDQFECSWNGTELNTATAIPAKMLVSSTIDGFATALQQMHIGDRWIIYIPYNLGYGSSAQGTSGTTSYIPAYSMLKFDVTLHSYYRNGQVVPTFSAKAMRGAWIDE